MHFWLETMLAVVYSRVRVLYLLGAAAPRETTFAHGVLSMKHSYVAQACQGSVMSTLSGNERG